MARVRFSWRLDARLVAVIGLVVAFLALMALTLSARVGVLELFAALILSITAALIAAHDLRTYWIPDRFTLAFAFIGATTTGATAGVGALGLALAISVVVALSLLGLALFYERVLGRAGFGLGDVKLVAASAFLVSPAGLVVQLGLAAAIALAFAAIRAWRRRRPLTRATRVPFGVALAPAAVLVWAGGWIPGL